jgi:hypothetical protein
MYTLLVLPFYEEERIRPVPIFVELKVTTSMNQFHILQEFKHPII